MSSAWKAAPPTIGNAPALNEAAAHNGWPMLCDESCDFSSTLLAGLAELWHAEAATGIPARQEMTARKLQPFMTGVAIFERSGAGEQRRYRSRLMGSEVVRYYGALSGKYVDEVIPEWLLPRWYAVFDIAFTMRKPVRHLLRADVLERSYVVAEYLCAPLAADNGEEKFVLAGMVFDGRRPWNVVEAEARTRLAAKSSGNP